MSTRTGIYWLIHAIKCYEIYERKNCPLQFKSSRCVDYSSLTKENLQRKLDKEEEGCKD